MGLTTLKADCEMPITEHGFCWPAVNYERSTSSNGGSTGANTKRELTQTIAGRMLDGSKRVFGLIVENVCNLTG